MELIEGIALSELCDYSFGDQSGQWGNIHTSFMKNANLTNLEFVEKLFEIKKSRNYMTLFIDNIRLYKRYIVEVKESDRSYVEGLMNKSDLLHLCSNFPDMKRLIKTYSLGSCIPPNTNSLTREIKLLENNKKKTKLLKKNLEDLQWQSQSQILICNYLNILKKN